MGPPGPPDRLPAALDYSWKWFAYHADQRLKAFNFYLVIVGVLVVGYLKCLELQLRWIGAVTATFGAVVSLAFWILDIRNTELVNYGRNALDKLEENLDLKVSKNGNLETIDVKIRRNDEERTLLWASMGFVSQLLFCFRKEPTTKKGSWIANLVRHQTWLRMIIVFGLLALFWRACSVSVAI